MRKADVEKRSPNPNGFFGEWVPAINVKWYSYLPEIVKKFKGTTATGRRGTYVVHEFGDVSDPDIALFWEWVERVDESDHGNDYPDGPFSAAEEIAREIGWEDARELADEVWANTRYQPKVYSSGRSGGWLIVEGLPDIDEWDAIAVSRWSRFEHGVKAILDDRDYQFLWHLYVNVYPYQDDAAGLRAWLMEDA